MGNYYESTYTGTLKWKEYNFMFVFDKKILKLIPFKEDYSDVSKIIKESFLEPNYLKLKLKEDYLIGECFENGKTLIFMTHNVEAFNHINDILTCNIDEYLELNPQNEKGEIGRLALSGNEINHIFPLCHTYSADNRFDECTNYYNPTIIVKNPNSFSTKPQIFFYNQREIKVYFSFGYKIKQNNTIYPLTLTSYLFLEFEPTIDYLFILTLFKISKLFIRFLCYRKNINISVVELSRYDNFNQIYQPAGYLHTSDMNDIDPVFNEIRNRVIKTEHINHAIGTIFQTITDKKLHLSHIPQTQKQIQTKNEANYILAVSAFEWEWQQYMNGIGQDETMKNKLRKAAEEFDGIIGLFGKRLYKNNGICLDYSRFGQRLASQRNKFAHGNLSGEFVGESLLDLIYLEYLIYAIQLKRLGLSDNLIMKAINNLFGLHVAL